MDSEGLRIGRSVVVPDGELSERFSRSSGPGVIAEQYAATAPVRAGQGEPYSVGDGGHQEAHDTGEAGQHEDAAKAAERAGKKAKDRDPAERAEIEAGAEEEVLPFNG